jgi:hypothetical protein
MRARERKFEFSDGGHYEKRALLRKLKLGITIRNGAAGIETAA